jgi:RNA polymerase sporulation-specific sigma factor
MKYNDYELVYMIKENEEALEYLLKKYEPLFKRLAFSFAFKYKNKGLDVEDIVQYCRIILCKTVDMYNPSNDVLFYSYLIVCLKRGIINYVSRNMYKHSQYNYMDLEDYDNLDSFIDGYDAYKNYIDYEVQTSIINFKNSLSFLDANIFELRYNGFSYKEIASLLEIEVKKVDNSLLKVRKKLEKYLLFS